MFEIVNETGSHLMNLVLHIPSYFVVGIFHTHKYAFKISSHNLQETCIFYIMQLKSIIFHNMLYVLIWCFMT